MTVQARAAALLVLCADRHSSSRAAVRGFGLVARDLGAVVASWAYADMGEAKGQRQALAASTVLAQRGKASWATVLAGPPGCGKTIAAARFVADQGGRMVHAPVADRWPYAAGAMIGPLVEEPWLLVDDLGDEVSPRASEQLRCLVSERYHHGLSTVITTMLLGTAPPNDAGFGSTLHGHYGDHFWSRVRPHFVALGNCPDLRGGPEPSTRGLDRARRLAESGDRLRAIARRGVDGPESSGQLQAFAELAGVDLDGREFAAALEAELARRAAMSVLAQQTTQSLAPAADDPGPVATDALAWLDSMEIRP